YGNACVDFYVVATLDGCASAPSLPMEVCMNVIPPNAADAGPDISVCEGQSVMLLGQPPSVGTGRWELLAGDPTGVTITNPDQAQTTVLGLQPGVDYVFRWYLSNGACVDYDFDDVSVFVDVVEDANAGPNINLCNVTSVTLDAEPPISGTGKWTQPEVQAQLGVTIVDPFNPQTPVNGLVPGNSYIFTWTVSGGCGESSDVVLVQISNEIAFAGQDFTDCGDGCTQLAAAPAGLSGGVWTSPDPELDIISPNDPTTFVCNLKNGDNILIWTIADGACGENSVDTLVISYLQAPETTDDVGEVGYAQSTTLNVLANDDILEPYTFNILQEPVGGSFTFDPEGNISYHARVDFVGSDLLVYEVCHVGCPDCSVSNLILKVGADAECDMPSIITPNDDGINDAFIVPCLLDSGAFPNSRLSIFNQWGDEVFRAQPYRNDWRGTHDGEDLPPGTYFYILDLGNGEAPTSGFLIIQR
ncbi:MAG: gliding motility-associated C-terminal domain-containing protein, partial [Bacteroidetes bacterium]